MEDDPVTDVSLRQFLLGQLDDGQRQRIESRFLTDPQFKERIFAAEQDLIDDYLDGSLAKADHESFLLHFAQTPEQQRKLRISRSVMDWAMSEANRFEVRPQPISVWSRLFAGLRLKPVFVVSIAVSAMVAIGIAILWLNYTADRRNSRTQEELARLNDPARLHETLPQMYSLELSPVAVRSAQPEAELERSSSQYVELRLRWIEREDYPRYRAMVRRFDDDETLLVDNLHTEGEAGKAIRLRLPVWMLKRGLYRVEISGVDAHGAVSAPVEYTFNVN
jgi:hypothetical protein